nr:hypothetical protein [Tanacetum cinerariifolium]
MSTILISLDSYEESVGTPSRRVLWFGRIPTTVPATTPTIDPPVIHDDTSLIPTSLFSLFFGLRSPSDSSSETSSDSSLDALSDSSSGHSSSDHSSPALPSGMRSSHQLCSSVPSIPYSFVAITETPSHSSSACPSRKRSRFPTTFLSVSSPIPGA